MRFWPRAVVLIGCALLAIPLSAQTLKQPSPTMPVWLMDTSGNVRIRIPIREQTPPVRIAARVTDTSGKVVQSFDEDGVQAAVYERSLAPLPAGTYKLSVVTTDRQGGKIRIDRFPAIVVHH